MNFDEMQAVASASVNRASGATVAYVSEPARGSVYCPKCGRWVTHRGYNEEVGWCNSCASPKECLICEMTCASNALFCTQCRNKHYKRFRYLMERYGLSQDDAVQQIQSEGGKSGQQVRRERELHQGSHVGYGHFQKVSTTMGLDEPEQRKPAA